MRDFRETKIKILSEEHSCAFQEAVIAAGGEWHEDGRFPDAHKQHYLYVNNDLVLEWGISASFFESHKYREIVFPLPVTTKNQEERNMKKFIGSKIIQAKPMNRLDYNEYRGWQLPENENGTDEGFLVEYLDGGEANHPDHAGYISWSPKTVFENAYRESGKMSFGEALLMLEQGKKVSRSGWNGKGMFLFLVQGSTFTVNRAPLLGIYPEGTEINYHAHVDMRTATGEIVPWLCSQTDMLAKDWCIVE